MSLRDDREHATRMQQMRSSRERMRRMFNVMLLAVVMAVVSLVLHPEAIGAFAARIAAGFHAASR